MSQYLTEEEISVYCTNQAGVQVSDVIIASTLIDGFVGYSFTVNEKTEDIIVKTNHRGKLHYNPVIEVIKATEIVDTPISYTKQDIDIEDIDLDADMDGYFTLMTRPSPFANRCILGGYHLRPRKLRIQYSYGYSEVPEDVKQVCAMLAQNIRQLSTFAGFKSLKTLDYTIEMGNPSFFTEDMRIILLKYKRIMQ